MAVASEVSSLAISVVSGALKLGKRLDQIQAEEVALRAVVPLAFPSIAYNPSDAKMRAQLRKLSQSTKGIIPDPLGDDRDKITSLPGQSGITDQLFAMCKKYGLLDNIEVLAFRPDAAFKEALRVRSDAWDLSDTEIQQYTYFVAAGAELRKNSLGFRLAATVLDVLAEVASQNMRYVINHEPTRKVVETIITRFSEPDLAEINGWGPVLRHALGATLNTVIDERESLAGGREWVERAISAVARARDASPNGNDFVLGIFQGRGINELLRGILSEAADHLSEGDADIWEDILADMLEKAAEKSEGVVGFQDFFQEHWHSLVGAGFASLQEHGPRLLDEDDAILKSTLTSAVGALADAFDRGPPNAETFTAVVEAAIGVFADPAVLEPAVREPWLRDMIASVADVVRDDGLRASFSQPALERYARGALEVMSRYPEVIAEDSEIVQKILSSALGKMSQVDHFGVGPIADVAVEGALIAIASNPGLLDVKYATAIGELAGGLAERTASGGISGLQAEAIVAEITIVLATNEALFLTARDGLADAVVNAVLDATGDDAQNLLAGEAVVATVRRILGVVASRGAKLSGNLGALESRMKEIVASSLAEASKAIGKELAQEDIPVAVTELIARWANGDPIPDPSTQEFEDLFTEIANEITARAA